MKYMNNLIKIFEGHLKRKNNFTNYNTYFKIQPLLSVYPALSFSECPLQNLNLQLIYIIGLRLLLPAMIK